MTIIDRFAQITWSKKITVLRTMMGLNQQELADKVGTTQRVVYLWESGRANPRGTSKKAICNALEITEAELFGQAN